MLTKQATSPLRSDRGQYWYSYQCYDLQGDTYIIYVSPTGPHLGDVWNARVLNTSLQRLSIGCTQLQNFQLSTIHRGINFPGTCMGIRHCWYKSTVSIEVFYSFGIIFAETQAYSVHVEPIIGKQRRVDKSFCICVELIGMASRQRRRCVCGSD